MTIAGLAGERARRSAAIDTRHVAQNIAAITPGLFDKRRIVDANSSGGARCDDEAALMATHAICNLTIRR
jgi:hypothetical protein